MLSVDQYEHVRTAHRVYGKSVSEIARLTGHSRNTVRKVLLGEFGGYSLGFRSLFDEEVTSPRGEKRTHEAGGGGGMNVKESFLSIILGLCLLALAGPVRAQQPPVIQGFVRDGFGNPLAGVQVRAWDGTRTVTALSDGKGEYAFGGLDKSRPLSLCWNRTGHDPVRIDAVRLPEAGALSVSLEYAESRVGGTFVVRLPTNPSTGYGWSQLALEGKDHLFESGSLLERREETAAPRSKGGAGSDQLWLYRAVSSGTGLVTLGYSRSWESVPPSRLHLAVLVVR
jgi:predicted secreted protein